MDSDLATFIVLAAASSKLCGDAKDRGVVFHQFVIPVEFPIPRIACASVHNLC